MAGLITGDVRAVFQLPYSGRVFGIAFSPDGRTLACTTGPCEVVLFEAAKRTGKNDQLENVVTEGGSGRW